MVSATTTIPLSSLGAPFYIGSVQHLHAVPGHPDWMVSETTEAGSVFDVGSIFAIPGSDRARALFRHVLYQRLTQPETWQRVNRLIESNPALSPEFLEETREIRCSLSSKGAATHHLGMVDATTGEVITSGVPANPSVFNLVQRFPVQKPKPFRMLGTTLFDYPPPFHDGMVSLEYLVRFGLTSASSVWQKYQSLSPAARKEFLVSHGLEQEPEVWQLLPRPLVDFSTKYEPEDRALSRQEALFVSGLHAPDFARSAQLALLGGMVVREMLGELELTLWDLKWEFALSEGALFFVDTIDTDSVRATLKLERHGRRFHSHINKQAMRDYYRLIHRDWMEGIKSAKSTSRAKGIPFQTELISGQSNGVYPKNPEVEPDFIKLQAEKMETVFHWLLGKLTGANAASQLRGIAEEELSFYEQQGALDALHNINGA